ncbi:MAG: adenylyltransferase/cytidyltransferase family protein [Provencibacterium sp.]|jgi:choline-phosphate cytidylyltransferase|nr:adenylyltransferase/cytidyltransferase family protein [Provencibacterium sp.]
MTKVITYGTYDLLHYGHIKLLERAKALGDYLIVGVTASDFDRKRGKINVKQSLMERIEAVRATGIADEIIVEEYEGQKIDDIRRLNIDIFTVGSDWESKFDYLNEYCKVIYLPRTAGVSSSEIRAEQRTIRLGMVGNHNILLKFKKECSYINGIQVAALCTTKENLIAKAKSEGIYVTDNYEKMLSLVDAVYIISEPSNHYQHIKEALLQKKHVLCEAPVAINDHDFDEVFRIADENRLVLMEGIKTAYSTAYYRLLLLAQSGEIGNIAAIDATCTSLSDSSSSVRSQNGETWNSICSWGPTAMLPIFQLLGTDYMNCTITSALSTKIENYDVFTKIDFLYPHAVATLKIGTGIKSEGELVVSGSKGYIYVPAPWWKTDYFELRYENQEDNRRHFYQLEGEGIRYEIINFVKSIETKKNSIYLSRKISKGITNIIEKFYNRVGIQEIQITPF